MQLIFNKMLIPAKDGRIHRVAVYKVDNLDIN